MKLGQGKGIRAGIAAAGLVVATAGPALAGFTGPTQFAATPGARDATLADLDGNGDLDLVVGNSGSPGGLAVLFGDGNGAFGMATQYAVTAGGTNGVAIGSVDSNNNAVVDVAISNFGVANQFNVGFNDGAGNFGMPAGYTSGTGSTDIAIAQIDDNANSLPDIVVVNQISADATILLGNGGGGFSSASTSAGTRPQRLAVGDFDGDGNVDLAITNNDFDAPEIDEVNILLGSGTGTFSAPAAVALGAGTNPSGIVAADFTGDGELDLAVGMTGTAQVALLVGLGNGSFTPPLTFASGGSPFGVAAGDLDGNGSIDLVAADLADDTISVFRNDGAGFAARIVLSVAPGDAPISVAIGDLNGDGDEDIVVGNNGTGDVSVFLNDGGPVPVGVSGAEID